MNRMVWIASYPKSGNTWMRLALTSLLSGGRPVDINAFRRPTDTGSGERAVFDELADVESSELTQDEILAARPAVLRRWAADGRDLCLLKVHEAFIDTPRGEPLFPADITRAALHIVRDPRDVAVSMAHAFGRSLDDAIGDMADPAFTLARQQGRARLILPQPISSWSRHTESWMDRPAFPVLTLRYEDMQADLAAVLRRVADAVGLAADADTIKGAVAATRFAELRRQEDLGSFRERQTPAERFFRRGIAGGWREELTAEQAARIAADHGRVMERLGYL